MAASERKAPPTHDAFVIEGKGDNAYWHKIGAAWPHEDGDGFNLILFAIPTDGRVTVRKRKPKEERNRR